MFQLCEKLAFSLGCNGGVNRVEVISIIFLRGKGDDSEQCGVMGYSCCFFSFTIIICVCVCVFLQFFFSIQSKIICFAGLFHPQCWENVNGCLLLWILHAVAWTKVYCDSNRCMIVYSLLFGLDDLYCLIKLLISSDLLFTHTKIRCGRMMPTFAGS